MRLIFRTKQRDQRAAGVRNQLMRLWGPGRAAAACKPRCFFLSLIAGLSYGAPRPSPVRRPRSDPRVRPPPSRSARLNALCLGSRRPRRGEQRLWGAARRGPGPTSRLHGARRGAAQAGLAEQRLSDRTASPGAGAWAPRPEPSAARAPSPAVRVGRLGTDPNTCFRSAGWGRRESSRAGRLSWDKGPIWAKRGETSPPAHRGLPGWRPHPTHRVRVTSPRSTAVPKSPAPGARGGCPSPAPGARGAGQCGGGDTYQRGQDAPALLVGAALGEDARVRAEQQRGRQHPTRGPRDADQQRAPPAPPGPAPRACRPRPRPRHGPPAPRPAPRALRPALASGLGGPAREGRGGEAERAEGRGRGGEAARAPVPSWGAGMRGGVPRQQPAPARAAGVQWVSARGTPCSARRTPPPFALFFAPLPREDQLLPGTDSA